MFIPPSDRKRIKTKNIVTPGDLITQDTQYMRGHGTYTSPSTNSSKNNKEPNTNSTDSAIYSSLAGPIEKINKLISVIPIRSRYIPEVGDVIIGRIQEVQQSRWKVDISSLNLANLLLSGVNFGKQRRKLESDELEIRGFFKEGDLCLCEVQQVEGGVFLHTRNLKGKLKTGCLVQIPSYLIQRSKNHNVKFMDFDLVIGTNGLIWIGKSKELTTEDVENDLGLLYSDKNEEVSEKERKIIARLRNVVKVLSEFCVKVSDKSVIFGYEVSLEFAVSDILKKEVKELIYEGILVKLREAEESMDTTK